MKKLLTLLILLFSPCIVCADGIAPMAALYWDIPVLILLFPIALVEAIYLYKKLKYKEFLGMLQISFIANVITTIVGCIFTPLYVLADFFITISINGCLEGCYGWEKLGFPLALLIRGGLILLPALFLFWLSYKIECKYIRHAFNEKNIHIDVLKTKKAVFNANVITYSLITTFLLFSTAWSMINWSDWKQTAACTVEHPLRGFTDSNLPPASIVEKRGECFTCNEPRRIQTTKDECDKCPNRHYTGKACVLKTCPPEKPIRDTSIYPHKDEDGYNCRSCNDWFWEFLLVDEKEPCQKCSNYTFDENGKCTRIDPSTKEPRYH